MLGIDLCSIERVEGILNRHGDRLLNRVFTEEERDYVKKKKNRPETVAGLYAAKEAMAKALGTGIGPVTFQDLEISHKPYPEGRYKGKTFALTISHEGDYALALAVVKGEEKTLSLPREFSGFLKPRPLDSHKGSVGKIGLIAGKKGMCGAFQFAGLAALRTGAGLVFAYAPREERNFFSLALPEAVVKIREEGVKKDLDLVDSLLIGPGVGVEDPILPETVGLEIKRVLDADALTYLSGLESLPNLEGAVLTPHEGEARRLFHAPKASREELMKKAKDFARDRACIFILKGPGTYVTDGTRDYINDTGNPNMAVGGMGDALAGVLAYSLTQTEDLFLGACFAVYLHGLAGDLAAEDLGPGLLPRDVIVWIPKALKILKKENFLF